MHIMNQRGDSKLKKKYHSGFIIKVKKFSMTLYVKAVCLYKDTYFL